MVFLSIFGRFRAIPAIFSFTVVHSKWFNRRRPDLTQGTLQSACNYCFFHWTKATTVREYQLAKTTTLFHREPSMKLCYEVPRTAVENLTLATPALRFKLHAHTVGEGTIFAKTTTLSPTSVKKLKCSSL